jgi:hypothetical protein
MHDKINIKMSCHRILWLWWQHRILVDPLGDLHFPVACHLGRVQVWLVADLVVACHPPESQHKITAPRSHPRRFILRLLRFLTGDLDLPVACHPRETHCKLTTPPEIKFRRAPQTHRWRETIIRTVVTIRPPILVFSRSSNRSTPHSSAVMMR